MGELKKKTLCIHWAKKKKARKYSNWATKNSYTHFLKGGEKKIKTLKLEESVQNN